MGNRAVISTVDAWENDGVGIYLHWDGSPSQVYAYVEYCRLKGVRTPKEDPDYAMARLTQIIANHIGGTLSIGIDKVKRLDCDNMDNGLYLIGDTWEIVQRLYAHQPDDIIEDDILWYLDDINNKQPVRDQIIL